MEQRIGNLAETCGNNGVRRLPIIARLSVVQDLVGSDG